MEPERGLASIWERHSADSLKVTTVTFVDESSHEGKTISLPDSVQLDELKRQVRNDRDFKPDKECKDGQHLKLFYPEEGLDLHVEEDHHKRRGGKKKNMSNMVELKDEARWLTAQSHWKNGYSHRRDTSLVKFSTEVCAVISSNVLAEATFEAARRWCCIVGVPLNLSSMLRLRKFYLVFKSVLDLVEYRDPTVPGDDGWGPRRVSNNCEPLSVACGAHLHWHLATASPMYFDSQVATGRSGAVTIEDVGVSPEYEPFQRLIKIGQGTAVRRKRVSTV